MKCFAEDIHVAYNIDDNYATFAMISMDSILKHNKSKSDYTFYILHEENNLSSWNKFQLSTFVLLKGQSIKFLSIDKEKFKNIDYSGSWFARHIAPIAFARIYLVDLLPDSIDKVLYIDADTLVNLDLKTLFDLELDESPIAMALDHDYTASKFQKISSLYCNSGVILFDTNNWRKLNISKKIFEIYNNKSYALEFIEQDLLNYASKGIVKLIDSKYNHQICDYCPRKFDDSYYKERLDNTVIHYISPEKPWTFNKIVSDEDIVYYKFWLKSPLVIYMPYYYFKGEMFQSKVRPFLRNYIDNVRSHYSRIKTIRKIYF